MKYLPLAIALLSTTAFAQQNTNNVNSTAPADIEINKTLSGDDVKEANADFLLNADHGALIKTTGEILVKLEGNVDFDSFNEKHHLTITQAYGAFYILKSENGTDLNQVIEELQLMPQVLSATLATANMSIEAN
ncbi:MAG: hypothetical protein HRT52_03810 [Colwellia sp.]|nr:hypothetical protein [Colwellia sp.]